MMIPLAVGCATGSQTGPFKTAPDSTVGIESRYARGLSYIKQNQMEKAQAILESVAKDDPNDIKVHITLGVMYNRGGAHQKAIDAYKKAIALTEKVSEKSVLAVLENSLGIAYRGLGKFKEAEKAYNRAMGIDPGLAEAHLNLGVLYDLYMNRLADAVRLYRSYKKLAGPNEIVDVWIADLEQRSGLKH